jgi:tRNA A-37 threonylcarbamoyl transferase component Bud32
MEAPSSDSERQVEEQKPSLELFAERFELIKELGRGGMSVVYQAREILLDRPVAIKVLNKTFARDEKSLQRFRNEAKACSAMQHPNIVRVYSFGVADDQEPFIVMELQEGKSSDEVLKQDGVLDRDSFEKTFMPVLDALVYAHEHHVIHRDLKPGNIIVKVNDDGSRTVKVLDFGIAKVLEDNNSDDPNMTVGLLGSPLYMSPEQCSGAKVDQRSDIYSIACVMYESIVGKPPFSGVTAMETMYEHLKKSVPKLSEISGALDIPRELFDVIIGALAKDPAARPDSMLLFQEQIKSALSKSGQIAARRQRGFQWRVWLLTLFGLAALVYLACCFVDFEKQNTKKNAAIIVPIKRNPPRINDAGNLTRLIESERLRRAGKANEAVIVAQVFLKSARLADNKEWLYYAHRELFYNYAELNDKNEARGQIKKAIAVYSDPISKRRLEAIDELCKFMVANGETQEALQYYRESLKLADEGLKGEVEPGVANAHMMFSMLLIQQRLFDESAANALVALKMYDRFPIKRNYEPAVQATFCYYTAMVALGKKEQALLEYRKTKTDLETILPADYVACQHFAIHARTQGLNADAISMFKRCLKVEYMDRPHRSDDLINSSRKELETLEKN